MRIFVLLFNAGTENEGIHTIQIGDRNKVLMFESEDDATRFGLLLEAQDFPMPTAEEFDEDEIKEFCKDVDYDWEIVPTGYLAIPPENNVEKIEWQPEQEPERERERAPQQEEEESEFSESELERIRRRLEGLL